MFIPLGEHDRMEKRASLEGKVVVVTGGTAGNGRAIAEACAREGAHVAVIARDTGRLDATRAVLEAEGVRATALSADVADAQALESAASRIERELGPIDIWINNAMTSVFSRVEDMTPEEFARVTDVTYLGSVYGTFAALRRMRARDRGHIIQIGSALAYRGIPLQAAYCGAKHALKGFLDSVRSELVHDGSRVRVSMVELPAHNTPQFEWVRSKLRGSPQPVPPVFEPETAARAVLWTIAHPRADVIVGWPVLRAVWGISVIPVWLADRITARTAYESQIRDEPRPKERGDNLFEPVPGGFEKYGRFGAEASGAIPWFTAIVERRKLILALALFAALFVLAAVL